MKQFNTFLSEQKELLMEKGSKGGKEYNISQGGAVAGLGAGNAKETMFTQDLIGNPLQLANTVYNMKSLFGGPDGVDGLWTNGITPQESKQLQRVFEKMPDGPQKEKVATMVNDLSHMTYSDDKQKAMDELVNELRKNTFSNEQPVVAYQEYTPYNNVFARKNQRMF